MPRVNDDVDGFMDRLVHRRRDDIAAIRAAILSSDKLISERVKWNAPSFCWNGDDRVTFRLQPGDRIELVFHRGVAKRPLDGFSFDDPTGLLKWATPDRGAITFGDDITPILPAIIVLVREWMVATADN